MNIETFENLRIKYKNKIITGIIVTIILVGIVFLITINNSELFGSAIIFSIIIGVIFTLLFSNSAKKEYTSAYKSFIVLKSLQSIFTNLNYEPERGMPYAVISATKMMNMGDRYNSNDFISGKYKDVAFSQADVHIEEEHEYTDSDGDTHTTYVTIFKGRWMTFDFNKNFKANIEVAQKGFGNNKVDNGFLFFKKKEEEIYKKVKMESEEFNKRFNVYAQSEHEAFYILTPSLMEKIERLDDNNSGKILLCFVNNRLHIGLYDGKDSFEPPFPFKPINLENELNKTNSDIKVITQFIDELNLDNDLFKPNSNVSNQQINVNTGVNQTTNQQIQQNTTNETIQNN